MSKIKNPRDKKLASLALDRRNTFGENDKASRKLIPLRKQQSQQALRRSAKQPLHALQTGMDEEQIVEAELTVLSNVAAGRLKAFRKAPDSSLAEVLEHQKTGDWTPKY